VRKQDVLDLVNGLPDELDMEELQYRLYVLEKLRRSEQSVRAGRIVPHDEAKRRMDEWRR
jgi:hypothetical protein